MPPGIFGTRADLLVDTVLMFNCIAPVWAYVTGRMARAGDLDRHRKLQAVLCAMAFVAVLAAVMSSLDAMILTLSSMLVRDVVDPFRKAPSGGTDVLAARLFALAVAAVVYGLALLRSQSVFDIASMAFAGYVTLTPLLILGVRWRRFNATGALASMLVGSAVLIAGQVGWLPTFGFLPVMGGFLAAFVFFRKSNSDAVPDTRRHSLSDVEKEKLARLLDEDET